mgnify:CR=1 FL=1
MKKIRITVMRIASYPELMAQYENPMTDACRMQCMAAGNHSLHPLEREIQGRCHYKQNLCVRLYQQEN